MNSHHSYLFSISVLVLLLMAAGCAGDVEVAGLQALEPPALDGAAEVDSLEPIFRWQQFDPVSTLGAGLQKQIRDISYDFKIWSGDDGRPGALVYERRNLIAPFHRLSEPLSPSTEYYWSVRARFQLDGNDRVTEWSVRKGVGISNPRRSPIVPNPAFLHFETP